MVALSIDTAANLCAVAVNDLKSGKLLASISHDIGRGHAEMLMDTIEQCLGQAGSTYQNVERIITTIGPGSFTGVRVGMSAARAIGLGLSKPVVGVTNLEACASYAMQSELEKRHPSRSNDGEPRIWVILDAKRDEVYFQQFDGSAPASKPSVCRIDELLAIADIRLGKDTVLCGSAAQACLTRFATLKPDTKNSIAHHLSTAPIEVIASLGMAAPVVDGRPEPLYLRGADAKQQAGFAVSRLDTPQNKAAR